ncbi:MAG: hypothetical protein H6P99_13 [Holophagaceae bacterium]|nr:hypothetical protein [Holophagaceae bacterium]
MPIPSATLAWTAVPLVVIGVVIGFVRTIRPVAVRPMGLVLWLAG